MNRMKMALAGGAVALSMFTGGVLGAAYPSELDWKTNEVAAAGIDRTAAPPIRAG